MTTEAIKGFLAASLKILECQKIEVRPITADVLRLAKVVKFELFFAVIGDYFGSLPREFAAELYSGRDPNQNHAAIARLVGLGHHVFTTNFDQNVDQLLSPGDASHFVHLHGTARQAESMILTMAQLADRKRPSLETLRTTLAKTKRLTCVGYSGIGDIDILPILQDADKAGVLIYWFGRRGFDLPTGGRVFHHDLTEGSNILLRWAGIDAEVPTWPASRVVASAVRDLALQRFSGFPPVLMLRALASVAHEARFGALALDLYGLARKDGGPRAVTDYEWGVAYERAGKHRLAAEHLKRAADGASGPEKIGHLAGAAFCYRQLGQLMKSKDLYDLAYADLLGVAQTPLRHFDNVVRGRVAVYLKLAASLPKTRDRVELVEEAGLVNDLALLRSADDPSGERPGRLELLREFAAFEIDILVEKKSRIQLRSVASSLWLTVKGHQDLEAQAKAARLVAAVDKSKGRACIVETMKMIVRTGASKRDLGKLLVSLGLTLIPFSPGRWQLLNPSDGVRIILRRRR